ncbi:MAG: acyl-CoA thioesterase [Candidatus Bathyarchaeaceae archaeon]
MKTATVDIRVRMSEVDMQGFAFHSKYFEWFSIGRIEYLRSACGISFTSDGMPVIGGQVRKMTFVVREISCQFMLPARFDDLLELHTIIKDVKGSEVLLEHELYRKMDKKLLTKAQCKWTCISTENFRPTEIPEDVAKMFQDP